jgi:hypothetical protein
MGRLHDFYQRMSEQGFVSPNDLPQNSQCKPAVRLATGSSVPRNTRFQGSGRMTQAGYLALRMSYQVASPVLPINWWQAFARIFFNARPRNAAQLRDFCQRYCETTKQMCDRAFSTFFDTPERGWEFVYVHLISELFPPEPDAIEAMRQMQIPGFIYANAPFKDFQGFGISRIDYYLSRDIHRLLLRMAGRENRDIVDRLYSALTTINRKQLADANVHSLVAAAAQADAGNPMRSMLAWYAVMLLEHHYSTCRRETKTPYWQVSLKRALKRLTPLAKRHFSLRWNVFVHMEPQVAVVSTLFALMIDISPQFNGVEGCKSAKDRATELLLYKPFVEGVLFDQPESEIERNLKLHTVHNLVFLMLYAHVPGTMDNGGYAKTEHLDAATYGSAGKRLRLLNQYLHEVRHPAAKYRASIFADQPAKTSPVQRPQPRRR